MRYAKLKGERPVLAPRVVRWRGCKVINPAPEKLTEQGYLPVIYTDPPQTDPGYVAVAGWYVEGDAIRQTWTVVEEPDEVDEAEAMEILFGGDGA